MANKPFVILDDDLIEMKLEGLSLRTIADRLGCCHMTVSRRLLEISRLDELPYPIDVRLIDRVDYDPRHIDKQLITLRARRCYPVASPSFAHPAADCVEVALPPHIIPVRISNIMLVDNRLW